MELKLNKNNILIYDYEDYELINSRNWYVSKARGKYVVSSSRPTLYLHRLILNAKPNDIVDHINGNTLDVRRTNLRFVTRIQNCYNSKSRQGSSIYKGVFFATRDKKWRASIRYNKKRINIGSFLIEKDAAIAYDKYARELHGEFARLNFPVGNEQSAINLSDRVPK